MARNRFGHGQTPSRGSRKPKMAYHPNMDLRVDNSPTERNPMPRTGQQVGYHQGRPIVRNSPDNRTVVVLCPYGHLYTTLPMKEWAGSWLEAKASDQNWTVRCAGALARIEGGA